ncbi:peptidoglycan-binding protein [Streptomyces sp. TRM70308]|uniref:peptidoglycan-binding protein n=1 Tax=Streptomyces sp. TRM70308 TaxID=3131932 RepID=UPI003CFCC840
MATPLTADAFLAALRREGVAVVERGDWRNHNRDHIADFGPVNGVMVHHTATTGTEESVRLCRDGWPELPGPLCQGVVDKLGGVHLIGHGRANHAGLGDPDVLAAVIREDAVLPPPQRDATDGNTRFYGFEAINLGDGQDPWPPEQFEALARTTAAVCRAHGWNERSALAHKEWTRRKIDPRGFTMAALRQRVGELLAAAPPAHTPFPGADWFRAEPHSPIVTAMAARLVAEGCSAYEGEPGPRWDADHRASYAAWQRRLGFTGADADGWPGAYSWNALRVPTRD